MHTHGQVIRNMRRQNALRHYTSADRLFSNSPFFWIGGLAYSLLATWIAGARLMATLLARGLPFAVYALFASHVPRGAKLVAAASALALFAGTLGAYADPQAFALAFARAVAFLIAACVTVHALRRAAQES